jgi:zinc transporter ZupT
MLTPLQAAALALFVGVHLFVGRMRFLEGVPRARWLSLAGGVAVAYVFVHMLPELNAHHEAVRRADGPGDGWPAPDLYVVALGGLVAFYALERHIRRVRARGDPAGSGQAPGRRPGERPRDEASVAAFALHAGSFALYNLLIGYLLVDRMERGTGQLLAYAVAMALHFLTSDFGLRLDYAAAYDRHARWVFSAALVAGAALGAAWDVPRTLLGALFAFLAGGVVLNVLKEELPEERQSRLVPFLVGAAGYALLLGWAG